MVALGFVALDCHFFCYIYQFPAASPLSFCFISCCIMHEAFVAYNADLFSLAYCCTSAVLCLGYGLQTAVAITNVFRIYCRRLEEYREVCSNGFRIRKRVVDSFGGDQLHFVPHSRCTRRLGS